MTDAANEQEGDSSTAPSVEIPQWIGQSSIPLVHDLNRQCIDVLIQAAHGPCALAPAFVQHNRMLWKYLHPETRARVIQWPFLLADLAFDDLRRWKIDGDARAVDRPTHWLFEGADSCDVESLVLEAVMFAHQAVRQEPRVAQALCGMSPGVAERLRSCTLKDVRALAARKVCDLRFRWQDTPEFWRAVLVECRDEEDEHALHEFRHLGRRLYCGEILRRRT